MPSQDYRQLLQQEFLLRQSRNPSYSLRSFARDLRLTPSRLSELFRGKDGLSPKTAASVVAQLAWSPAEAQRFLALVQAQSGRSALARQTARIRLQAIAGAETHALLRQDVADALGQWYHAAIVEMTRLKDFRSDPAWIAERLDLQKSAVTDAIARLRRLGLVKSVRGKLSAVNDRQMTASDVPSEVVRGFHRQVLAKAERALQFQGVDSREVSASFFPVAAASLPQAKETLRRMRRALVKEIEAPADGDEVYCLAIQFFNVGQQRGGVS